MIRLLFLGLLLLTTLSSNELNTTSNDDTNISQQIYQDDSKEPLQKVLYVNFKDIPTRVVKGEIFSITLRALCTVTDFRDISYELSNAQNLKLIDEIPDRDMDYRYYYDTYYFLATGNSVRTPDFKAILHGIDPERVYKTTTVFGKALKVITLNPKKNFSNIVANSFELIEYKTTPFDNNHNIVVFVATATNCDIAAFNLQNVFKQGIESVTESYLDSKLIYFAVIDKRVENFSFSYFNLKKNKFILLNIPITVIDDSVTTQSDLKPKDQSKVRLKMGIATVVAFIAFVFVLWRKKNIYLVFIILPLSYIGYIAKPSQEVCLKVGANIYLLPVNNGTIFEKTTSKYYLPKEGSVKKFIKVKLKNNKIGWVKNEDICSF